MADDEVLDDDEPVRLQPGMPPEMAAPLARFKGTEPERPKWFSSALAREPERRLVPVSGANIELLTWGQVGKPGLILVHGNSAHADWWSFISRVICMGLASLRRRPRNDWRIDCRRGRSLPNSIALSKYSCSL